MLNDTNNIGLGVDIEAIIAGFPVWVAKQPASKAYDYLKPQSCAFAQYLHAMGWHNGMVGGMTFDLDPWRHGMNNFYLPPKIDDAVRDGERTFGALSQRLAALNVDPDA